MPRYLAFLRGINLGKRRVKMDHLKAIVAELPVSEVATFIASGNVVFTSSARDADKLAATVSAHLEARLGYEVTVILRSTAELAALVAAAPLGERWADAPAANTQVALFAAPLPQAVAQIFDDLRTPTDAFAVRGRELFWRCATRMSDSTVWTTPPLKSLRLPVSTMRNLNTLQKLTTLYPA